MPSIPPDTAKFGRAMPTMPSDVAEDDGAMLVLPTSDVPHKSDDGRGSGPPNSSVCSSCDNEVEKDDAAAKA